MAPVRMLNSELSGPTTIEIETHTHTDAQTSSRPR